jgi:hypothetical protein
MNAFLSLGEELSGNWTRFGFSPDRFAQLAAEALQDVRATHFKLTEIINWVATAHSLPRQSSLDLAFGQPPLTVYWHERFRIELLFWHTGTTGIHQHAFSGAFRPLFGTSIHSVYSFIPGHDIGSALKIGRLTCERVELLDSSHVRSITSGQGLIHSLFHLDMPTVTLLARTHSEMKAEPEFEYRPPGLAVDPSYRPAVLVKKLQLLQLLRTMDSVDYEPVAELCLEEADPVEMYFILREIVLHCKHESVMERLELLASKRHPKAMAQLLPVLREELRTAIIVELRQAVMESELRFFLALLLNLSDRQSIIRLIKERVPSADVNQVMISWCRRLPQKAFDKIEIDDLVGRILECLLQDLAAPAILEQLRSEYGDTDQEDVGHGIAVICDKLRSTALLAPLFR